jgi:hypothetical protein
MNGMNAGVSQKKKPETAGIQRPTGLLRGGMGSEAEKK